MFDIALEEIIYYNKRASYTGVPLSLFWLQGVLSKLVSKKAVKSFEVVFQAS